MGSRLKKPLVRNKLMSRWQGTGTMYCDIATLATVQVPTLSRLHKVTV